MPPREYHFWVYILASRSRSLYIGVTNDIYRRTGIHREGRPGTYTSRYNIQRLVYWEYFRYVRSAIAREKQLKHWTRAQKIELIERTNPTWKTFFHLDRNRPLDLGFRLSFVIPEGNLLLPFLLSFPKGICFSSLQSDRLRLHIHGRQLKTNGNPIQDSSL